MHKDQVCFVKELQDGIDLIVRDVANSITSL